MRTGRPRRPCKGSPPGGPISCHRAVEIAHGIGPVRWPRAEQPRRSQRVAADDVAATVARVRTSNEIAQVVIPVPGLRPELHSTSNEVIRKSNLEDKLQEVAEAMRSRPWLGRLIRDVNAGRRTAVVTTSLGALVMTVAVGAGLELGVRHGKDLRDLARLVNNWRRRAKRLRK